ncbi:MAG: hypothetical protein PF545_01870 [Elusimicrobia bacterium]|jgi:ribosomal protein L37E|nr:hypothetical protein [Elusimicrobiota bacterium]
MANKNEKEQRSCPECGKKIKKRKTEFCSSCGWELYTPKLEKNWNLKVVAVIIAAVTIFFIVFYILKPVIYFNLDKV